MLPRFNLAQFGVHLHTAYTHTAACDFFAIIAIPLWDNFGAHRLGAEASVESASLQKHV